jgi:hypothetical protein
MSDRSLLAIIEWERRRDERLAEREAERLERQFGPLSRDALLALRQMEIRDSGGAGGG